MVPSSIKAVSFDCSMTLVRDQWDSSRFAVECAERVGLEFDQTHGYDVYTALIRRRWAEFRELNLSRDQATCDAFWDRLTLEWLALMELPAEKMPEIMALARERLFGENCDVFSLYADTLPCLDALREAGYKLAVLSNWDNSLHRVLQTQGIDEYFDVVVASLEEGIEKPQPEIFEILLRRLGLSAEEVLHIGDNPLDDVHGAQQSGLPARLIDRSLSENDGVAIHSLTEILGILQA